MQKPPVSTAAADGKQDEVVHYNLDMVLALGFRVRQPVEYALRLLAYSRGVPSAG